MIYLELFYTFFKIGLFTFGGGYAMLPLIQDEVIAHNWIPMEDFINFIAVSESTPGPFAINMATYVGTQMGAVEGGLGTYFGGLLGGVCSTLGVVMPSFIVILIVAKLFEQFKKNNIVKGAMSGLKPAAVGLIASAVVSMALIVFIPDGFSTAIFTSYEFYISLALFAVMSVLAFKKVHPILIIVISAVVGIVTGFAFKLPV